MPRYTKGFLQIPQGTEGIYLEEAYRHRRIVRSIEEVFTGWGYLPAQVPIFDFFDTYRDIIGERNVDSIYRLIDREGDLLMLRADITLFLAKQVGLALKAEDLPLRICYADSVLRHQDSEDISRNEFFQVGAELIGKSGIRGDVEVLALLIEVLSLLQLPDVYIHLGTRKLFSLITAEMESARSGDLHQSVVERDPQGVAEVLSGSALPAKALADLFMFIGSSEEFAELRRGLQVAEGLSEILDPELDYLVQLSSIMHTAYPEAALRLDLSEIGGQDYYTGMVFQAYAEGADRAVASGGRYDELLGHFGMACGSVGFSMFLRKIESLVGRSERFDVPEASFVDDSDIITALQEAHQVRKAGGIAIL